MNVLFSPASALLDRLSYPRKFAVISVLFILPLALTMTLLIAELNTRIAFSQKELYGNAYLRHLRTVKEHVDLHQLLVMRTPERSDELAALQATIDAAFGDLVQIDGQYGAQMQTTDRVATIRSAWLPLRRGEAPLSEKVRAERYMQFRTHLRDLELHVGDMSNLILDPDLDTYYLMDAVLLKLPVSQDLRLKMQLRWEQPTAPDAQQKWRTELGDLVVLARANQEATTKGLGVAFANNAGGMARARLSQPLQHYMARSDAALTMTRNMIVPGERVNATAFVDQHALASAAAYELWDGASAELDLLLLQRIARFEQRRMMVLVFSVVALSGVLYLLIAFYRSVMRTVSSLEQTAQRLVRGESADLVSLSGRDELAQVARSFNHIAKEMLRANEQHQHAAAEREELQAASLRAQAENLHMQEAIIRMQASALAEQATPLIPITDQVVVMPLIGTINDERAAQILSTVLQGVERTRAGYALLDITGVAQIDTSVAQVLIDAARAVQLLGAQVVLTGIRPQVAQALVQLGIDLSTIVTHSSLQSGLAWTLQQKPQAVVRHAPGERAAA